MLLPFNPAADALFLDIDGTLLDIAPTAGDVAVPRQLVDDLEQLSKKLKGALAFISGRTIEDVDALFAPLKVPVAGVHGAEWRLTPHGPILRDAPLPPALRDEVLALFVGMKGVRVEDKESSVAIHYRQAKGLAPAIAHIVTEFVVTHKPLLSLLRGRKVFEIVQTGTGKGVVLDRYMKRAPFKERRPVFLGDDITDLSAMGACLRRGGSAARIGHGANSCHAFKNPAAVRAWIHWLASSGPTAADERRQA
jgi:trehalose 6-phosphate phosphatase